MGAIGYLKAYLNNVKQYSLSLQLQLKMAENGLKALSQNSLAFEKVQTEKRKWQNKILKVDISLSRYGEGWATLSRTTYICVSVCVCV